MEWETGRRIGEVSVLVQPLHRCIVVKELSCVPTLTYGHELWVVIERTRSRIKVAEISSYAGRLGSPLDIG